jgi:poly [ADP-ribose] polymerase
MSYSQVEVYGDYNALLNQSNISMNNNKFYVLQLLTKGGNYWVFSRWGRVGENGNNACRSCQSDLNAAIADFKKKYDFIKK